MVDDQYNNPLFTLFTRFSHFPASDSYHIPQENERERGGRARQSSRCLTEEKRSGKFTRVSHLKIYKISIYLS